MNHQERERDFDKIRKDKENFKHALETANVSRRKALETQKSRVAQVKQTMKTNITNSSNANKQRKQNEYKESLNEKHQTNSTIKSNNNVVEKYNKAQCNKIRTEHTKAKEDGLKKQKLQQIESKKFYMHKKEVDKKKTTKLKEEVSQLEKIEEKYIENIKNTRQKTMGLKFGYNTQSSFNHTLRATPVKKLNLTKYATNAKSKCYTSRSKSIGIRNVMEQNEERKKTPKGGNRVNVGR